MGAAVGIDLGTSNTVVACVRDGRAVTLPDEEGRRLIPSVVSFHPNGSVLVGDAAKERRLIDPANTIYSVKRLIGRSWAAEEVQQARGRFPFELREGTKNSTLVVSRGESYALAEISAFVLRRAKAIAERALGETVDRAVVTVPANFNDLQRASTKVAGKLAGLEVLRILNEPTAAALAYGQTTAQNERLAVYDLGGGTFDVTLLDLSGNVFEVLATAGDTALGGDDIDLLIADIMADQIVRTHRFDPRVDVTEFARLRIYAERLKLQLSSETEASIEIADLGMGEGGKPVTIVFKLTRAELERRTEKMIDRTFDVSRFAIETVSLKVSDIDRVILVGGPTRMPLVQRRAQDFFQKAPALKVNPDEVVALGAAIQAHVLDRGRKTKGATKAPPAMAPTAPADSDEVPRISAQTGKDAAARSVPPVAPRANPPPPVPAPRAPAPPAASLSQPPTVPVLVPQHVVRPGAPAAPTAPPPELVLDLPKRGTPRTGSDEISLPRTAPQLTFDPPPMRPPMRTLMQPFGNDAARAAAPPLPPPPPAPAAPRSAAAPPLPPPPVPSPPVPTSSLGALPPVPTTTLPATTARLERPVIADDELAAGPSIEIDLAPPAPRMATPLLIDVTPLSLRVETVGGYCDALIAANTAVPCDRTRTFLTATDGQTTVIVRVAQGESNRFAENTYLGELELTGITPAPRGETQIAVTFEIDADGILNVKARDGKSGRQTQARLQLLGAQTEPKDVEEMMRRQSRHAVM